MKVLIDLPESTLEQLEYFANKKGWSRKKYMEIQLTNNVNASALKEQKRENKSKKSA